MLVDHSHVVLERHLQFALLRDNASIIDSGVDTLYYNHTSYGRHLLRYKLQNSLFGCAHVMNQLLCGIKGHHGRHFVAAAAAAAS